MEVERKKRQLESVKRQRREANLETSDVDDVLEAGEVLLDQMERDVVRDVELEQEFSHLMEEENDEQVNPKNTLHVLQITKTKIRLEIGGRRVIRINCVPPSPLLSCPVLDSMLKVQPSCPEPIEKNTKNTSLLSSENWMYIVQLLCPELPLKK